MAENRPPLASHFQEPIREHPRAKPADEGAEEQSAKDAAKGSSTNAAAHPDRKSQRASVSICKAGLFLQIRA